MPATKRRTRNRRKSTSLALSRRYKQRQRLRKPNTRLQIGNKENEVEHEPRHGGPCHLEGPELVPSPRRREPLVKVNNSPGVLRCQRPDRTYSSTKPSRLTRSSAASPRPLLRPRPGDRQRVEEPAAAPSAPDFPSMQLALKKKITQSDDRPAVTPSRQAQARAPGHHRPSSREEAKRDVEPPKQRGPPPSDGLDILHKYYVVAPAHFLRQYRSVVEHEAACGGRMAVVQETTVGLNAVVRFRCGACRHAQSVTTVPEGAGLVGPGACNKALALEGVLWELRSKLVG